MNALALGAGALAGVAVLGTAARRRRPGRVDALRHRPTTGAERGGVLREGFTEPATGDCRSRLDDLRTDPRVGAGAVVLVVVCWLLHPMLAAVVVAAISVLEPVAADRAARRHETEVRTSLPDVIDLFRSSVDAGLTIGGAIDAVVSRTHGAWRDGLGDVQRQVALGERRAVALRELDRLGDAARPLTRALIASERDGAPLVVALDALARDARLERRRDAEERARRLPVQLLFPLVLCILPAFGLLTVVPLLAGTIPSLSS
jgi:tight adherence protein C